MKRIELLKRELKAKLRSYPMSIVIILISLTLSFAVAFPITAYLKSEMEKLDEIELDMRTYRFDAYPNDKNEARISKDIFEKLFFSGDYPEIARVYAAPSFRIIPETLDDGFVWTAFFYKDCPLNAEYEPDNAKTSEEWFDNELYRGRNDVAVVSQMSYPTAKVGDTIKLLGKDVEVIAVTEFENVLPWSFINEVETKDSAFGFVSADIVLSEVLTDDQAESITEGDIVSLQCKYDITSGNYLFATVLVIAVICAIVLIIMLNMRNLFVHIFKKDAYRTAVMKICGARKADLITSIYAFPIIICSIGFILGLMIHICIVRGLLEKWKLFVELSLGDYAILYAASIVFLVLVLLPATRKILKNSAVQSENWR